MWELGFRHFSRDGTLKIMDDWESLRTTNYDEDVAWQAFLRWVDAKRLTREQRRKLEGDFLVVVTPLIGCVLRSRFRGLQPADCDDICSSISLLLLRKVRRNHEAFRRLVSFTAVMSVTIRNLILDYLRRADRENRDFSPEMFERRPCLSVPKAVDVRLILDELPEHIAAFALERDRLGFGHRAILVVARMMVAGKDVPEDMLRNWLAVEHPERCIAFVTLMARRFLFEYRDKFTPVLEGELIERVASVDSRCHIL